MGEHHAKCHQDIDDYYLNLFPTIQLYRTGAGTITEVRTAHDAEYFADKRVPNHTSRTHRYFWNKGKSL